MRPYYEMKAVKLVEISFLMLESSILEVYTHLTPPKHFGDQYVFPSQCHPLFEKTLVH